MAAHGSQCGSWSENIRPDTSKDMDEDEFITKTKDVYMPVDWLLSVLIIVPPCIDTM